MPFFISLNSFCCFMGFHIEHPNGLCLSTTIVSPFRIPKTIRLISHCVAIFTQATRKSKETIRGPHSSVIEHEVPELNSDCFVFLTG